MKCGSLCYALFGKSITSFLVKLLYVFRSNFLYVDASYEIDYCFYDL